MFWLFWHSQQLQANIEKNFVIKFFMLQEMRQIYIIKDYFVWGSQNQNSHYVRHEVPLPDFVFKGACV